MSMGVENLWMYCLIGWMNICKKEKKKLEKFERYCRKEDFEILRRLILNGILSVVELFFWFGRCLYMSMDMGINGWIMDLCGLLMV